MPASSLQDLYVQKLQLLLDAERQGLEAMPQLAQFVLNQELRDALEVHQQQTEEHVERLQRLVMQRGQNAQQTECLSMSALIDEAQSIIPNIQDDDTIDAFIIGAQQAVEHHEIAAYGTARTWARQLGYTEDAEVLQRTLDEEGNTDKLLTSIAEQIVNPQASAGADREVGIDRGGTADRAPDSERGTGSGSSSQTTERGADMR